ncbi:hypothetical protein JQC91_06790 [Jannaschia sp. Os4]|uniref:laminin B domain-containing protein n=1 Tax=Jannaschia sp. Os4 TaxID=2807617 RepID=UPI00193A1BF4|nr:laminin B domain-containing protein [Jannaschia sp. Os4]MBM2576006.1 hypothetical protein [Jannaschia sp. Os4]
MSCRSLPPALRRFAAATSGAVTVDWTVLTAALVGIGLATGGLLSVAAQRQGEGVSDHLDGLELNDRFRTELADIQFLDGPDGFLNDGPGVLSHADGPGSDGAPGFLHYRDGGGTGLILAPEVLSGDLRDLYGGTIAFDMAALEGSGAGGPTEAVPLLTMTTADGRRLELHSDYAPAGAGWSSAEVTLRADAGWRLDGAAVTEPEMRTAMADVTETRLRMQHLDGRPEATGLDNLTVTTAGF